MQTSSILIGILLFAAALFFIYQPFRQKQRTSTKSRKVDVSPKAQREAVLSALRDLDFDFKTGKISEEDYAPLRAQLMEEAAHYIEETSKEEERLESLVLARRSVLKENQKCKTCGSQVEAGQRFCATCGSAVQQESCPSCGNTIRSGDQFCPSCGIRLGVVTER